MYAKTNKLKQTLTVLTLGLLAQTNAFAAESDRFVETVVKKSEAGQAISVRQLCLKDKTLNLDDDVVAVLNKADGKIMADKGKGFVSSPVGTLLKEGDRVVALAESSAEIVFFDCCAANLNANNLVTVNANPGCKAAIVDANPAAAVAGTHPASFIPPAAGLFILIKAISVE